MRIPNQSQSIDRRGRGQGYQFHRQTGIRPAAPNPCPDPTTIYNPETGQCVSKLGCTGQCVMNSMGPTGLFNPFSFGICMARNCL